MKKIKVVMFSKKYNAFCDYAEALLKTVLKDDEFLSYRGVVGDDFEYDISEYQADYVISFVSPWIISKPVLDSAQKAAINFHPGSPDYPGSGCYNFALYENSPKYGVTVHHMKEKVDSGDIVMTSYFDIMPYDSVETLKLKSMNHLLWLLEKTLALICAGEDLPVSEEKWQRKPFTKKEMYEIFEIDPQKHDEDEIARRIRAAAYPSCPGAYILKDGERQYLPYEERDPIVK